MWCASQRRVGGAPLEVKDEDSALPVVAATQCWHALPVVAVAQQWLALLVLAVTQGWQALPVVTVTQCWHSLPVVAVTQGWHALPVVALTQGWHVLPVVANTRLACFASHGSNTGLTCFTCRGSNTGLACFASHGDNTGLACFAGRGGNTGLGCFASYGSSTGREVRCRTEVEAESESRLLFCSYAAPVQGPGASGSSHLTSGSALLLMLLPSVQLCPRESPRLAEECQVCWPVLLLLFLGTWGIITAPSSRFRCPQQGAVMHQACWFCRKN